MLNFSSSKPCLGIELSLCCLRLAVLVFKDKNFKILKTLKLPLSAGLINAGYATLNIDDIDRLINEFRENFAIADYPLLRKTALSLPDSVFRIQTFEFDELPKKAKDKEQLIYWRLEKSAYDISDSILQYHIFKHNKKSSVLTCLAKRAVIKEYENTLLALGLEPWFIGPTSLNIFNFYRPYFANVSPISVLIHISGSTCATIIEGPDGIFYRYKDIRKEQAEDIQVKLVREIGDFIHYYTHKDHEQKRNIDKIYITGDGNTLPGFIEGIRYMTSLDVEVPMPSKIVSSTDEIDIEMAAALGVGYRL